MTRLRRFCCVSCNVYKAMVGADSVGPARVCRCKACVEEVACTFVIHYVQCESTPPPPAACGF